VTSRPESVVIEEVLQRFDRSMSENDRAFVRRVFGKGIDVYRRRIAQYGFCGFRHVLDAGCGFGQWSLALARENSAVTGLDISSTRLTVLERLAGELGQRNLTVRHGETWRTDCPAESFDAIFCYGVIFLTPWRATIAEFARLLQPGGRLYLNANGFGWYRYLWRTAHNATADYDPRLAAAKVLLNTLSYERGLTVTPNEDILIEPEALREELARAGFIDLRQGAEGTLTWGHVSTRSTPFFPGEFEGEVAAYEVMATKPTGQER
jgi:ubiquinone/menaquinone biosynthesis C-methylase UbiE